MSWAAETSGTLDLPAGSYRLRVSARDRDEGAAGEFSEGLVDAIYLSFGRPLLSLTQSFGREPQTPSIGIARSVAAASAIPPILLGEVALRPCRYVLLGFQALVSRRCLSRCMLVVISLAAWGRMTRGTMSLPMP